MSVSASEGEFQGYVIEWTNRLIKQERLPFDQMTQLSGVKFGKKRREADAVLWLDRAAERALCEFEFKVPDHSPWDAELVSSASAKADKIGAPFFVTWNVNDLVLWDRSETDVPLLQRHKKPYKVADARSIEDILSPAVQEKIRVSLRLLLRTLADLHLEEVRREAVFLAMPPDENFIDMVHSYVRSLAFHFGEAIRKRSTEDRKFRRDLARWFAQQGWSHDPTEEGFAKAARQTAHILLNKIIFYDALRVGYPDILPELKIGRTVRGDQVRRALNGYFTRALDIDYQPVFTTHLIDELEFPERIAGQLVSFIKETARWEYRDLRYDIIGRVFERLVPADERRWLGQFFTRSDIVDLIIGFCVSSTDGPFLDPACGAGTFLVRLYSRLQHLDPDLTHQQILERLWGFDIAAFPAHLATINLYLREPRLAAFPRVVQRDFFSVFSGASEFRFPFDPKGGLTIKLSAPRCQAVVGNPPYTRQEEMEEVSADAGSSRTYKGRLLTVLEKDFGRADASLSKRAGIYTYFFLHGTSFLAPGGRLGFVTSNSWLDVDYGKDVQRFLLERFKVIAVLESRCERWFEDAAVNAAVTIVQECAEESNRNANPVRFVSIKRPLTAIVPPSRNGAEESTRWYAIEKLVDSIEETSEDREDGDVRVRVVRQEDLWEEGWDDEEGVYAGAKWGKYLRAPEVYFALLARAGDRLTRLSEVASIRRGYTTGANDFFYVKDLTDTVTSEELRALGAPKRLPKRLRVIEAGDGSRHLIEGEFLVPAILRVGHVYKPLFDTRKLTKKLVMIDRPRSELRRSWALKYIRWGEEPHRHRDPRHPPSGYHERETCSSRALWYDLGARAPAPVLYPIAHKRRPVVGLNRAGVQTADNFLDVVPADRAYADFIAASLFSTFSQLQAEVEGRVNFGEGVLKTQVVDARKLMVIDPCAISSELLQRFRDAFSAVADRQIELVWDEVKRRDRKDLDDVMLEAMGIHDPEERRRVRGEIYEGLCALISERMDKPKTVKPKRSSNARLDIVAMAESVVHDEIDPEEHRSFPHDFLPTDTPGDYRELPEGPVAVFEGDLYTSAAVTIGDETTIECRTSVEARYLAYALLCSGPEVLLPTDAEAMKRAVQDYETYVTEMGARLDQVIAERTPTKRIARAVKKETFRLMRLVEQLPSAGSKPRRKATTRRA